MSTDYCLICDKCKERIGSTNSTLWGIKYNDFIFCFRIEDFYRPGDERLYNHDEEIKENIFYVNSTQLISEFLIKHIRCKVYILDMDSMLEEIYSNYNIFSTEKKLHYKNELEVFISRLRGEFLNNYDNFKKNNKKFDRINEKIL
ncbi:hypothetical protein [Flavobacterium sp.]|uniref:hypothetical protein n=1 Tax=Flavobacterium sp. TaxID=239 RepID=UPI003F6984BB